MMGPVEDARGSKASSSDGGQDADAARARREGTEHLRAAALEMIAAARSFLDVAEEVVGDRRGFEEASELVVDLLARARSATGDPPGERPDDGGGSDTPGSDSSPGGTGQPTRSTRVRRIDVE